MSAHALLIPELDEVIERGSPERRAKTLRRITTLFLDGAGQFNDDHLGLFDLVFNRLIVGAEVKLRTELSHRLAPLGTVPAEVVRRLAHDDDIAVAGPVLARSRQLAEPDLVTIARTQDEAHLLAIAGRGRIGRRSPMRWSAAVIATSLSGWPDNPGARLSERGFFTPVERAKRQRPGRECARTIFWRGCSATSCSRPILWCSSAFRHRLRPRCRRRSDARCERLQPTRATSAPRLQRRSARSGAAPRRASMRRMPSNSPTRANM